MLAKILLQWLLIISSAGMFILADSLAANWGKNGSITSILLMCVIAPLGYLLFGKLNSMQSLSVSSGLVNMILIVGTVIVGITIFQDEVTTRQWIGLCLAFLAVAFMI